MKNNFTLNLYKKNFFPSEIVESTSVRGENTNVFLKTTTELRE